jgi:hypothetical protein
LQSFHFSNVESFIKRSYRIVVPQKEWAPTRARYTIIAWHDHCLPRSI